MKYSNTCIIMVIQVEDNDVEQIFEETIAKLSLQLIKDINA